MSVSCLPHPVAVSAFIICSGLCACTEMCVLYVSFGSKVRPRTFWCVAMRSAVLFIFRSRLLLYSARSGVTVVLSGFSVRLFCFCACVCRCDSDVIRVGPDLNWCSWWWYVCSVYVE